MVANTNIAVITAVHRRPLVTALFLQNFEGLDVDVYIAGSKDDEYNYALCKNYNWVESQNRPVSNKFNKCMEAARGYEWYLCINSDTLFEPALIDYYLSLQADYCRLLDYYFLDIRTLKGNYFEGYGKEWPNDTIGTLRFLHKDVVEQVNYRPWRDERNEGLDKSMRAKLQREAKYTAADVSLKRNNLFACDIKSLTNIWEREAYFGPEIDIMTKIEDHLGKDKADKIREAHKQYEKMEYSEQVRVKAIKDTPYQQKEIKEGDKIWMKRDSADWYAKRGYVEIIDDPSEPKTMRTK